jgi:hypothetical protein
MEDRIYTFKELNESSAWWGEEDDDIADKIIKCLTDDIDVNNVFNDIKWYYSSSKQKNDHDIISYMYEIKRIKRDKIDPYGEEEWDEDKSKNISVLISQRRDGNSKKLNVDGVNLVISNKKFNKIWNILSTKKEDMEKRKVRIEMKKKKEDIRKKLDF